MAKYVVTYTEVYQRRYIVEVDSQEEAQEKLEFAAENVNGLLDAICDFDHWSAEAEREASAYDMELFDELPEE